MLQAVGPAARCRAVVSLGLGEKGAELALGRGRQHQARLTGESRSCGGIDDVGTYSPAALRTRLLTVSQNQPPQPTAPPVPGRPADSSIPYWCAPSPGIPCHFVTLSACSDQPHLRGDDHWITETQTIPNGGSVSVLPGHPPSLSVTPSIGVADVRHRLGPGLTGL
jgi:hypothetical protein